MELALALLTLLCLFVVPSLYHYQVRRRRQLACAQSHGCMPPPQLINELPLGVDRLIQIFRADRQHRLMELFLFHFRLWGSTMRQRFLFTTSFGTNDPKNIRSILKEKSEDWSLGLRPQWMSELFGEGIFTQDGPKWKQSRDLLSPHFASRNYEDLKIFDKHTERLLRVLPQKGALDLQPYLYKLTLDITTDYFFGTSVNSLTEPEGDCFSNAFNLAQEIMARRSRLPELSSWIGGREFTEACHTVHKFADSIIARNQDHGPSNDDFLSYLSRDCHDRSLLRSQIINVLIAGRDTTASLLSWTFFLLPRHPHVLEKLRREVNEIITGTSTLTQAHLSQMSYLKNTLKEVLRLYPPVAVNARTSTCDTILPTGGGKTKDAPIFVPKGTQVAFSVYSLHRRPDIWGMDCEVFRPDRWDNEKPANLTWAYLPFNGGPRTCLGMDFALTEAAFVIAKILMRYELGLPEGQELLPVGKERQTVTLVLSSTDGCKVVLSPRDDKAVHNLKH